MVNQRHTRLVAHQSSIAAVNRTRPTNSIVSRLGKPSRRPLSPLSKNQGTKTRPATASRVPAGLARSELAGSPCMNSAMLLVIPQEGQGMPVSR